MDKEMQRNMLLAIALSILIMIVWTRFFAPKPPERPPQELPEQAWPTEQPGEFPLPIPEVQPAARPAVEVIPLEELAEAQDVVVETQHMAATFTTLGGRLSSLRLTEYDSKKGGQVEMVPFNEEMQWPLALAFNDPEFGNRTENFVYEHRIYEPSGETLRQAAEALRACSGKFVPAADEEAIRRQIDLCLPKFEKNGDLRALVLAIAAQKAVAEKSRESLTGQADLLANSKVLVFSRQMTPRLRLVKAFVFPDDAYSFDMHVALRNTADYLLDIGHGRASYAINWAPGMESSERVAKQDQLVGVHLVEKNFGQKAIRKLKEEREFPESLRWIGLKRQYFFIALEPGGGLMSASMKALGNKEERVRISLNMQPVRLAPGDVAVG
ncbi:MAG: YidC/Oxa1 family insertase periplasmic-domain containing protein, partial [Candidatus Abyssubacteria bacterium]|nr:YidC/Oxa1 family insertase periplasmic-domain containing protein [Candidatus Abyssubacteria bacterium]